MTNIATIAVNSDDLSPAARVRSLEQQAKELALIHCGAFATEIYALHETADEIANCGNAYPVGVREEARKLAEIAKDAALRIKAIMSRGGNPGI